MRARSLPGVVALWVVGAAIALAQTDTALTLSPDFSDDAIGARARQLVDSWTKWARDGKHMEDRAFRLPMAEAREAIQRALGEYLDFIDGRRAYGQAVAAYVERLRAAPKSGDAMVVQAGVYQDQALILAANLSALQAKLDDLRESPEWVPIRRAVQADRDAVVKLQGTLRSQAMPRDLLIGSNSTPVLMSSVTYLESERLLTATLQALWTHYYQALADRAEQRTGGSAPLTPIRSSDAVAAAPPAPSGGVSNPLAGVWAYIEGSEQFNGAGEPQQVLLELWIENGTLLGRYRAGLSDFSGDRKIDLRLRARTGASQTALTMEIQSSDPQIHGQITLEGPLSGGTELMCVHTDGQAIPRGREMLHRR